MVQSKKVNVRYFASLREASGKNDEAIETIASTPNELYAELVEKYDFMLSKKHLKVAVNNEFAAMDYVLQAGDTVVFIPPVAGG